MPRTPTISFHSQTLTCPLHLSVIQSTLPGVNHHPCWPAITVCSQNEYWPPCCTPAWTPHPNHNALGLPPASLRPPSFYLSLSIHNTSIYGLPGPSLRVLYVPAPPLLMPPPYSISSSLCRLLSNYFWYLTWVTVFNNMFKNKRALLKGWRGRGLLKGQFVGRPGEQACLHAGHSFDGAHGSSS